jgi:hypothetical protein
MLHIFFFNFAQKFHWIGLYFFNSYICRRKIVHLLYAMEIETGGEEIAHFMPWRRGLCGIVSAKEHSGS